MCVDVTLWFGCGGVVSVCRLKHYIKLVSLYSTIKMIITDDKHKMRRHVEE